MSGSTGSPPTAPQAGRRRLIVAIAAGLAILVVAGFALAGWSSDRARAQADLEARQNARAHARQLESELQKFSLLPRVLTEFPDVRAARAHQRSEERGGGKACVKKSRYR